MTSYLIDINVWLALTWEGHVHSHVAHAWLRTMPARTVRLLFCRITQLGLLRLTTNRQVMGDSVLTLGGALETYSRWMEDPRVHFAREPQGLDPLFAQAIADVRNANATKFVMDIYLAAFAETEGAVLVTLDKGLQQLARNRGLAAKLIAVRESGSAE